MLHDVLGNCFFPLYTSLYTHTHAHTHKHIQNQPSFIKIFPVKDPRISVQHNTLNEIGFGGWRERTTRVTFGYMYSRGFCNTNPNCVIDFILSTIDHCAFINSSPLETSNPSFRQSKPLSSLCYMYFTLHVNF